MEVNKEGEVRWRDRKVGWRAFLLRWDGDLDGRGKGRGAGREKIEVEYPCMPDRRLRRIFILFKM